MFVAKATIHMAAAWAFFDMRPQPNTQTPIKVDSRKNAAVASIASGGPKISPTYLAYSAQFMPNWNSMVSPVTTPSEKFTRKSLPQKRAMDRYCASPVRA